MSSPSPGGWPANPLTAPGSWPGPPPPRPRSRLLLAVLIPLVATVVAVAAVGGVLLLRRGGQPDATPVGTSTPGPRPATPAVTGSTREPTPTGSASPEPSPGPSTESPSPGLSTTAPSAAPVTERPTPTAEPTPTAAPPKKPRPKSAEDVLVRNPLYDLTIAPSDCSQRPRPLPTSKSSDERYLNNLIGCMVAAYQSPLKTAGYKLTRPSLVIYSGTVATPCGQGLKGYPVFYCGSNETVYSSAGSTAEYGSTLRLGGYWIVFHEFGHHVQQRIGVLDAAYTRDEGELQISRRIELQADCFMGMTSTSVRSTKLTARDRDEMTSWREQVPDKIHGKSASQLYWVRRGFDTNAFARCSTWSGTKHLG